MVLVPLAQGFEEIEAVSIIDVLRRAGLDVVVASISEELSVVGANNITLKTDKLFKDVDTDSFEMVVLAGGFDGTENLANSKEIIELLQKFDRENRKISAICAAPYVLYKAGVLKENFTCYPSVEDRINQSGFTDKFKVVKDKNIITSRGPGTAICFALEIVKELKGEATYSALKGGLLADFC